MLVKLWSQKKYDDWDKISVQLKQKDGTRVEIDCPAAIISYSKFMAGVNRGDPLWQYYHVRLKSSKMYTYIFWFMFDVANTNSFILYPHFWPHINKPHDIKSFQLELAKNLIGDYNSRKSTSISFTRTDPIKALSY